jgi:uncharacterized protein YqjF (DUF2071 family)
MAASYSEKLKNRLQGPRRSWLDVRSDLLHFALISYALPAERLRPLIPKRFEIPTFPIQGRQLALMSAVPFLDADFRFARLFPFLKFRFPQTNYRVYIVDRQTGEHGVWFFGTTLGSPVVELARALWRIPWYYARYDMACAYSPQAERYEHYRVEHHSAWADAVIEIEDTGEPMQLAPGFGSLAEQVLVLTHPVDGYYVRLDGRLGTYSVWHGTIPLTKGLPRHLYFSLYEELGLLSREEMQHPHSIYICPKTTFDVYLPPQKLSA